MVEVRGHTATASFYENEDRAIASWEEEMIPCVRYGVVGDRISKQEFLKILDEMQ